MQAEQTLADPAFDGTDEEQALAADLFQIFRAQGRFFSDKAPIRLSLAQLAEVMAQRQPRVKTWPKRIDEALSASPDVFVREAAGDDVFFVTTRQGTHPSGLSGQREQVLTTRFAVPLPKRERPVHATPTAATPPTIPAAEAAPTEAAAAPDLTPFEVVPVAAEVAPVATPAALEVDAATASDDEIAAAIRLALGSDMSVAHWGDQWIGEERLHRFSRGDLRRIEDFIREQPGGVVSDTEIAQDVLGVRPNAADYASTLFAVNYRLSRETREFEYLGSATNGLWSLANPAAIGATKRKASEIGQDYRVLLEYGNSIEAAEEGLVEHILSFYEYSYGVLPLDANMRSIMPAPGFRDQRAARVTFESPQTSETVQAEVRFPTGNRGGFIVGLEQFFAENLVPGAVLTIEKTDQPLHYLLEYFQVSGEDRKLLHLDEKKGKYTFRPTTYYCATQDEYVLSDNRFPRFADQKPLDERTKRHPEQVIHAAFERGGENVETADNPKYYALFSDLLAAANVERPVPAELLRDILTSGKYPEFSADETTEDAFFYTPAS
ncbi:MAG TPA: hypothetical protein PKA95_09020 [Thermomicrobiales bacterium]|nr:hypothetical protein [Thermomicrobiales bacterium]